LAEESGAIDTDYWGGAAGWIASALPERKRIIAFSFGFY
jgi:hypothetical protein